MSERALTISPKSSILDIFGGVSLFYFSLRQSFPRYICSGLIFVLNFSVAFSCTDSFRTNFFPLCCCWQNVKSLHPLTFNLRNLMRKTKMKKLFWIMKYYNSKTSKRFRNKMSVNFQLCQIEINSSWWQVTISHQSDMTLNLRQFLLSRRHLATKEEISNIRRGILTKGTTGYENKSKIFDPLNVRLLLSVVGTRLGFRNCFNIYHCKSMMLKNSGKSKQIQETWVHKESNVTRKSEHHWSHIK